MTWTAVGSELTATATTFTFAPAASGNIAFFVATGESATVYASGITSLNTTWTLLNHFKGTTIADYISVFQGVSATATSETATIAWSGTTPTTIRGGGFTFHSSVGSYGTAATVEINSSTNTWPANGVAGTSLYFGYAYNSATQGASTTTGFTSATDTNGNPYAYNLAATSTSTPVFPDTGSQLGFVIGIAETATTTTHRIMLSYI